MFETEGAEKPAADWAMLSPAGHEVRPRKLPVVIVMHGERSSAGHVGRWLVENGYPLDVRKPKFGHALPETLAEHAGAVVFGGAESANDSSDFIKSEIDWIGVALRERKPFLGVCLGAQMLAKHLGGRVDYHSHGHVEIGYHPVRPTEAGRRLTGNSTVWPERVYQWHREGFEVPTGAALLAEADGAFPNQAFAYGQAAIGLQFHPEIDYNQVLRWSGSNPMRMHLRGAVARGVQIDDHFMRARAVRGWLHGFMRHWLGGPLDLAGAPAPELCPPPHPDRR